METDYIKENKSLPVGTYKKIMSNIEFMQSYLEKPSIFKSDSEDFKSFLIESFCFLHSDFHFLSLQDKDIDAELVKASLVLQILPVSSKNISKLFDNMDGDDINKFWLKFFTLFTIQNGDSIKSSFKTILEEKITFFKDIKSSLDYIDYEVPTSPTEKLSNVDTAREIESWIQTLVNAANFPCEKTTLFNGDEEIEIFKEIKSALNSIDYEIPTSPTEKLSSVDRTRETENWVQPLVNSANVSCEKTTLFNGDEELRSCVNIEKLIIDLNHVMSAYESLKNSPHQQNNAEHVDFFCNLINLAETMSQYHNNLNIISSPLLDESNFEMLSSDKDFSENLNYIKRCNDFLRELKSKMSSVKKIKTAYF